MGGDASLEIILVLLISALLTGALFYIDDALVNIVDICLKAETYMASLSGTDWFSTVYSVLFSFGVSLIVLKFLKKGFETYVLWTEGDPDADPILLLTNFIKAMFVAIAFPTMYGWMVTIVIDLNDKLLKAIGLGTDMSLAILTSAIESLGIFTAIVSLVWFIMFCILYIQFLARGLEMIVLRLGVPIACVGLLDSDKGIFGAYIKKFFQSLTTIVVQISLAKLSIALMVNQHLFWGIACILMAMRTPKFLQEFMLVTGSGSGGFSNKVYHTSRIFQMARSVITK